MCVSGVRLGVCLAVFTHVLSLSTPEVSQNRREPKPADIDDSDVVRGTDYEDYNRNSPFVIVLDEDYFDDNTEIREEARERPKQGTLYSNNIATNTGLDSKEDLDPNGRRINLDKFSNKDLYRDINEVYGSIPETNADFLQTKYRHPVLPRYKPIHHPHIPIKFLIARDKIRHKIMLHKLRMKARHPLLRSSYVDPENQNRQKSPDFLDQMLGSSIQDEKKIHRKAPKNVYFTKTETVNLTKIPDDDAKGYLLEDKVQLNTSVNYAQSKGSLTNYSDTHTSVLQTVVGEDYDASNYEYNNKNSIPIHEIDSNDIPNEIVGSPFAPDHYKGEYKPGYEFLGGQFIKKPHSEHEELGTGNPDLKHKMPYAVNKDGQVIDFKNLIEGTTNENVPKEQKDFARSQFIEDDGQESGAALVASKSEGKNGPRLFVDGQYTDGHASKGNEILGQPSYKNDEKRPTNFIGGQFTDGHALEDNDLLRQPTLKNNQNGPTDSVGGQFIEQSRYNENITIPETTTFNSITDLNKDISTDESILGKNDMPTTSDFLTEATVNNSTENLMTDDLQNNGKLRSLENFNSSDGNKHTFNKGTNTKPKSENINTTIVENGSILGSEITTEGENNIESHSQGPALIFNTEKSYTTHTPEKETFLGHEDVEYVDEQSNELGVSILVGNNKTGDFVTDRVSRSPNQVTEGNVNAVNQLNNDAADTSEVDGIKSDSSNILANRLEYPGKSETTTTDPSEDSTLGARLTFESERLVKDVNITDMVDEVELYAGKNKTNTRPNELETNVGSDSSEVPTLAINDTSVNNTITNICFALPNQKNLSLYDLLSGTSFIFKTARGLEIPLFVRNGSYLENCNSGTGGCKIYFDQGNKPVKETTVNKTQSEINPKTVKKRDTTDMESEFIKSLFGFEKAFEASTYKGDKNSKTNKNRSTNENMLESSDNNSNKNQFRMFTLQIAQPNTNNNPPFYGQYYKTVYPTLQKSSNNINHKSLPVEVSTNVKNLHTKIDKQFNWLDFFQRHDHKKDLNQNSRMKRSIDSNDIKSCSCDNNAILQSPVLKPTLRASDFANKRLEILTSIAHFMSSAAGK